MDNFKNEHNSAADGDTLVFESPAAATNANGEPADGGNSGFFKKTFASVRSFFAKLFSDKKGANESMHSNRITKIIPVQNALRRTKRMHRREFLRRADDRVQPCSPSCSQS